MADVNDDGFVEAGTTNRPKNIDAPTQLANTNPNDDPRYAALLAELQGYHRDLFALNLAENPVLCGEYLGKIRLAANKLFAYLNIYIDEQVEQTSQVAIARQNIYEQQLALGKSPSASMNHAGEMTRINSANLRVVELRVKQIQNDYERFNGLCIYLQSRIKEFNTERMLG